MFAGNSGLLIVKTGKVWWQQKQRTTDSERRAQSLTAKNQTKHDPTIQQ